MKAWGAALALMGLFAYVASSAQSIYDEQGKLIRANESVTTLGAGLFGDKVNLYNGALEFIQTDASLPGNSPLSVSVGRRLTTGTDANRLGLFADWELEIPHLHGLFASTNWTVLPLAGNAASANQRCSRYDAPPEVSRNGHVWPADEYWHGSFLHAPGAGSQELLRRDAANSNIPNDGQTYPVVTRSMWSMRCLTSMARGSGEGFLAVAPDGTQYRFDWMVSRNASSVRSPAGSILLRYDVWILPTVITDRFGNTVNYTYDSANPWRLTSIQASDGRSITLSYVSGANRVASISDGSRTWTYSYRSVADGFALDRVTQPDASSWQFSLDALLVGKVYVNGSSCDNRGALRTETLTGSISHPSGASGSFSLKATAHGRSWVTRDCRSETAGSDYATLPRHIDTWSLSNKTLSGPGLTNMAWDYTYGPDNASWAPCNGCAETKTVSVADPLGHTTRYTFGNRFALTEGQLLQIDEGWSSTGALRTTATRYRSPSAGPYPTRAGYSTQVRGDGELAARYAPEDQRVITQQGTSFTWQGSSFDTKARATVGTRSSSLGYTRTETIAFADNAAKWVLGQVASVTEQSTGAVMVSNTYDADTANLLTTSQFGKLQQSFSYNADGTVYRRFDAAGRATTFSNYKRGLAQNASYPDGNAESAEVHNIGVVTSTTDAAGFTTSYGYDAMGRLNQINRPSGDSVNWNATALVFEQIGSAEYDLPAGHWRQIVSTGNARRITYFDGLWRAVLTKTFDNANPGGTGNDVVRRFDADGRTVYESYPTRGVGSVNSAPAGTSSIYDALGRSIQTSANSELGVLNTTTNYLTGFKKQVINPRGYSTTTSYQAFDQPSEDAAVFIAAPEGLNVSIGRDVFGKPTSITRSGAYGGGTVGATRSYVYDNNQRLCKTIEPETGATVQDYDAANNVAWRATGLPFTATNNCNRGDAR